jgi:hypothetical protein
VNSIGRHSGVYLTCVRRAISSSGAPRRPELTMVQPSAPRVSAICSVPIGTPRTKIVKVVAPASWSGAGT